MPFSTELQKTLDPYLGRQWIDSHCHFDFENFDCQREEHWQVLQTLGCAGLVIPGVMAKGWDKLIGLCESKPWGYALGLHPYFLDEHLADDIDALARLAREKMTQSLLSESSPLVAIGEFGLDYALEGADQVKQRDLCLQQLLLAEELGLPVILHVRKAYDEMAAMVRRTGFSHGGIIHAFSGSLQQGQALIALGFKLGIGGAISHSRATKLRKTLACLPLESIVLETDSPDMRPAFWSAQDNSPLTILLLAQIVASVQNLSLDQVIFASNNNVLAAIPRLEIIIPYMNTGDLG